MENASKRDDFSAPNSLPVSTEAAASSSDPSPGRRQSTIRFTEDTNTTSRSPMSRGWRRDPDEITPIQNGESPQTRNYNTQRDGAQDASPSKPSRDTSINEGDNEIADEAAKKDSGPPWYKRIAEKYGSVALENKGSVARDHLALERTFLAWLRTSLAFASIGIAITQLFRLNSTLASRSQQCSNQVPLSPYLGHSIPVELLPYLQQSVASAANSIPSLGPTLLDQLLLLPPSGSLPPGVSANLVHGSELNEHDHGKLRHVGKPLGATFLGISIIILFIGFHRYFEAQHWIIRGKFPASRGSIFVVAFIAAALIIASLVVILVVAPANLKK